MNAATTDACMEILDKAEMREPVLSSLLDAIQLHLDRRAAGAFRVGAVLFLESIWSAGPDQNCKGAAGRMEKRIGTFYGVSVGPGDPEPRDPCRLSAASKTARSSPRPRPRRGGMLALDIAKGAVDLSGKTILPLRFAMSLDPAVRKPPTSRRPGP